MTTAYRRARKKANLALKRERLAAEENAPREEAAPSERSASEKAAAMTALSATKKLRKRLKDDPG
jgi:hypothetical protein